MIASAQSILRLQPIKDIQPRTIFKGMSYGLSSAGYDIRVDQDIALDKFSLASSIEEFQLPNNLLGVVHDKSSWARQGLAVNNTVIEPGWKGFLTLELVNNSNNIILIQRGSPIAQIVFHFLDEETDQPYAGKYQNQSRGPQKAISE